MKRLLILLALLVGTFMSGCAAGLVDSGPERSRRIRNTWALELRQMNDDWDSFWLVDKPSRMTYWHVREGN